MRTSVALCTFIVGLIADVSAYSQERLAGHVKVLAGAVSVERAGQTHRLTMGDAIFEADLLRSGPDGRVGITLMDGTRVSLGPNTEVTLATFTYAPAEQRFGLVLRVARGIMEYISGRLGKLAPESIRIETPSSIVGVRGTRVLLEASQP